MLARVDATVERIVADHAVAYCGLPVRRRDIGDASAPGVEWSIDHEVVVEFRYVDAGPSRVLVRDISLLAPLPKALRSRHVLVQHAPIDEDQLRPGYDRGIQAEL